MPTIACLGWGSLVWRPESLPIRAAWALDGPDISVELHRQSRDNRLTFVIAPEVLPVKSLWALMSSASVVEAANSLRKREGIPSSRMDYIGTWEPDMPDPLGIPGLSAWARLKSIDAVVWTALPAKFAGAEHRAPSIEEAISYLRDLPTESRSLAEEYIRRAPSQVDTPIRRQAESAFGWFARSA